MRVWGGFLSFLCVGLALAGVVLVDAADPKYKAAGKSISLPGSGCVATPIGCYSDCLAGDGDTSLRTLPISPGGCCGDSPGACKDCPQVCSNEAAQKLPGFQKDICPSNKKTCAAVKCDQASLTGAKCADYCAMLNPNFKFAGTEYSTQCFCGVEMHDKATPKPGGCDMPCGGNSAEKCGGNCAITMYQLQCGSAWGGAFLLTLFLLSIVYVGAGIAYNHRARGVPLELGAWKKLLPNTEKWVQLSGLVVDGAQFSYAHTRRAIDRARGLPEGDYARVPERPEQVKQGADGVVDDDSSPPSKATAKGPRAVEEQRDESQHSSKQRIRVVVSPGKVAAAASQAESQASDDDELVE